MDKASPDITPAMEPTMNPTIQFLTRLLWFRWRWRGDADGPGAGAEFGDIADLE